MTTTTSPAAFPLLGALATPLATATDTDGAFEQFTLDLEPGARSPRHTLPGAKVFVVTQGTVRLTLGDETLDAVAGASLRVPAGAPHSYVNASSAPASLLVTVAGTGQLDFLRGMSDLTRDGAPDPAAVQAHAAAYGVTLLRPTS